MKRIVLSALIAGLLAGSAGLAHASTPAASSGSWLVSLSQLMACAAGNSVACMPGGATIDTGSGDPSIKNN